LGGKALTTFRAFPAAANFCAIDHRTGVNDSGIIVSAERANHLGVSPFEIPRISNKCMYWRIGKTTVKTLLMEVLLLSTPTSSGNYKVFLETLQDERGIDIACRAPPH
jgi:hypothetical protein